MKVNLQFQSSRCRAGVSSPFVTRGRERAFTLLEAMIAMALFFMAIFAILDLVGQGVRSAHSLNQMGPTAGMVAAQLSLTNKLEEGSQAGDFSDMGYDEYTWEVSTRPHEIFGTNGYFTVDIVVFKDGAENSALQIELFRPESDIRMGMGGRPNRFAQPGGSEGQR